MVLNRNNNQKKIQISFFSDIFFFFLIPDTNFRLIKLEFHINSVFSVTLKNYNFHWYKIIYIITKFKPSVTKIDIINNNNIPYFKTQIYILLNNKC